MAMAAPPQFVLFLLISSCFAAAYFTVQPSPPHFDRSTFPPEFIFGAASAAYQNEGAAFEGGRGPSIWDTFTHKFPEKIADRSNGDVANDFYHRYKDDVKLMKNLGLDTFRLSISWSRILPNGKISGGVNKEGIAFYNNVFNELLANGITPFVTLFHWDVPQALEDEYGGFRSPQIIDDFRDFSKVCFDAFGDRVKKWTTLNEPFIFTNGGYDGNFVGNMAPGRCSDRANCATGNSSAEPYIVSHHLLLSHAAAVKLYRDNYQGSHHPLYGGAIFPTAGAPRSRPWIPTIRSSISERRWRRWWRPTASGNACRNCSRAASWSTGRATTATSSKPSSTCSATSLFRLTPPPLTRSTAPPLPNPPILRLITDLKKQERNIFFYKFYTYVYIQSLVSLIYFFTKALTSHSHSQ